MRDLNLTLIQTPLHWENPKANRDLFTQYIDSLEKTDLIILPEMFTTGFSMNTAALAETMQGDSVNWMREKAIQKQTAITGSLIIREAQYTYNRLLFMHADGRCETYDKRHLFRMGNEHQHYQSGRQRLIASLHGWRICPLICYDLRFPVWSRNRQDYDILIYIANWPSPRRDAWRALLAARSAENLAYTIGVNRTGIDGKQLTYNGDSAIIDMTGKRLWESATETVVKTATLSFEALQEFRIRFPLHLDADNFQLLPE